MAKQRLRIVFVKGPELKYISHLDLALAWERALRRAGVPLAYSQGHTPHARMQIASGLPLGYMSSAEMIDVMLNEPMTPTQFGSQVGPALPQGLKVKSIEEVPLKSPSLQSALREAEYRVTIETQLPAAELAQRVASLLAADYSEQRRLRKGREESFDLRPLVKEVKLAAVDPDKCQAVVTMRLSAGQRGNARPDAVLAALGLADAYAVVERTHLAFEFDND
jgi:radical SAM-linked protein